MISVDRPLLEIECFCCKPKDLGKRSVNLKCPGGSTKVFEFLVVTSCNCQSCEYRGYEAKYKALAGEIYGDNLFS